MAEERLGEGGLSPTVIAKGLNVSVRTLHRSFTGTGESLMGYVRRRRLEQARQALLSGHGEVSVSELAQRWHFADSSHFIRAFRVHFGITPARVVSSSISVGRHRTRPAPGPQAGRG
ncbi:MULTISPECIES: helix-turn-helix transcriptional regulator [Streptomyces]